MTSDRAERTVTRRVTRDPATSPGPRGVTRHAVQSIGDVTRGILDRAAKQAKFESQRAIAVSFLENMIREEVRKSLPDDSLVHIKPSVARKSAALGLFTVWRIYELLKHYDRLNLRGAGKFVLTDAILNTIAEWAALDPITVKRIILTPSTLVQGVYWSVDITRHWREDSTLYIELRSRNNLDYSLSGLAEERDVYDPWVMSKRKALLRLEDFKSLQTLEAVSFSAWLVTNNKYGKFTGRWCDLRRAWSRDRRTLLRWIEASGVRIIPNLGFKDPRKVDPVEYQNMAVSLQANNSPWVDRQRRLTYHRANTYQATVRDIRGKRGICSKKAAAHLQGGGGVLQIIRTNHEATNRDSEKLKRVQKEIDKDPTRAHYIHYHTFMGGWYTQHPARLWEHYRQRTAGQMDRRLVVPAKAAA